MAVTKKELLEALPVAAGAVFLVLLILFSTTGCSQKKPDFQGMRQKEGMPGGMQRGGFPDEFNRTGFNETEMRQRLAEMEKLMNEACVDKAEGDACSIESPRGKMAGTCGLREDILLCQASRNEWQMPLDGAPRKPSDEQIRA